tara:strand:+ start:22 stop:639 length:618 start_codon:yes stop_codon:yes gene_type:complete
MAEIIKDGRTGDTAKVDANNRLHTQARTLDLAIAETLDGNAYNVFAMFMNMTTDTENAILYLKNTGDADIVIDTIIIDTGPSTGGVTTGVGGVVGKLHFHTNPSAGTLIDYEQNLVVVNKRIGNPVTLSALAYGQNQGATVAGQTLTGGVIVHVPHKADSRREYTQKFAIPKGQAFGISYKPPASNTGMDLHINIILLVDTTSGQ